MRLLIIGDINSDIKTAIEIAQSKQAKVSMVDSIEEALSFLREGKGADLVLIDVRFNIETFIQSIKQEHISTPVIAYGVQASPKEAVNAIKAGAKEFLPLPPNEELIGALFAAISNNSTSIIGNSPALRKVMEIADKIACSDANVLITGPSGTGKEVFANYIHNKSLRAQKAFVRVNCAAIPENLLESELFGHEKGAFTGALSRRIGKFEESNGGTLLLDEISEMDIKLQAKLLRAIQEKEIDRVGGSKPVKVDLRIIATSNRDLPVEVKRGTFREDLYYRLNIISIELPPLSERSEDIEELATSFIKKYALNNKLKQKTLSREAVDKMLHYQWPGNIRELENIIYRAVLLSSNDKIEASDINIHFQSEGSANNKPIDNEKQLIINTVGYCLGDLNHAANILGISIEALRSKLTFSTASLTDKKSPSF